jgi:hypothetical protein
MSDDVKHIDDYLRDKSMRRPKPGEEGGVRNNFNGAIEYDPITGQYFDLQTKHFIKHNDTGKYSPSDPESSNEEIFDIIGHPWSDKAIEGLAAEFRESGREQEASELEDSHSEAKELYKQFEYRSKGLEYSKQKPKTSFVSSLISRLKKTH